MIDTAQDRSVEVVVLGGVALDHLTTPVHQLTDEDLHNDDESLLFLLGISSHELRVLEEIFHLLLIVLLNGSVLSKQLCTFSLIKWTILSREIIISLRVSSLLEWESQESDRSFEAVETNTSCTDRGIYALSSRATIRSRLLGIDSLGLSDISLSNYCLLSYTVNCLSLICYCNLRTSISFILSSSCLLTLLLPNLSP